MRVLQTILIYCFLTLVSIASFAQDKSIGGTFYTDGYYSGLTLILKPDRTFTLKYQGPISSDTAAGIYKFQADTITLKYNYNNYDTIISYYKKHHVEIPIEIQLAAGRVVLRPTVLVKKRFRFYVVDETTGHLKTFKKNGRTFLVYLQRSK